MDSPERPWIANNVIVAFVLPEHTRPLENPIDPIGGIRLPGMQDLLERGIGQREYQRMYMVRHEDGRKQPVALVPEVLQALPEEVGDFGLPEVTGAFSSIQPFMVARPKGFIKIDLILGGPSFAGVPDQPLITLPFPRADSILRNGIRQTKGDKIGYTLLSKMRQVALVATQGLIPAEQGPFGQQPRVYFLHKDDFECVIPGVQACFKRGTAYLQPTPVPAVGRAKEIWL